MNLLTLNCLFEILRTDLIKYYKKTFIDDVINKCIWVICILLISAYVFPQMGMTQSYASFMAISAIVSSSFWDAWGVTSQFVSDLESNRVVQYYLTLPVGAPLFFIKQILFYMLRSMISSLIMIPLSKLILLDLFDVSNVSWVKFAIAFLASSLFCATLSLLMTSLVKGMHAIDNVSMRFLFPLWFFGGSQFAWYTLHEVSPLLSYISLCNPLLYAMEATRVTFLGQSDCLPFWICIVMLILFSLLFGYLGTKRLIKRLDCV